MILLWDVLPQTPFREILADGFRKETIYKTVEERSRFFSKIYLFSMEKALWIMLQLRYKSMIWLSATNVCSEWIRLAIC